MDMLTAMRSISNKFILSQTGITPYEIKVGAFITKWLSYQIKLSKW